MNALWIVFGIGLVGAIVSTIGWLKGESRPRDLGFVSHQWIAEHRVLQGQERQR